MRPVPLLETDRLVLRAFRPADAPAVERLAGARAVADTTLTIPHPYPVGGGAEWIATHADAWDRNERLTLAIAPRGAPNDLLGAIGLHLAIAHSRAELGYWIGVDYWGRGYATEAACALTAFAFTDLGLRRVEARAFTRNPASARVMQKVGMRLEGIHPDACLHWGQFEEIATYAILAPGTVAPPATGRA